ncbi:TraR/DksA family transcriptional regulator [Aliagarivorans taiwanensis]|uniref:TraR/DksA family transcriptional regulator n=1 Tax=Aliagarivorans taiwanensis TaxID=561966 RepID=UPI0004044265|nr:TraR/DksA family transcriptional regulator [Aliagarivorans taiwanensis]
MITHEQIEQFRQQLESQLAEIQARLEDDSAIKRENEQCDEADRASQEENQQMLLNRRQHDLAHVKSIRDALKRISEEDYGFCESCGDDISLQRLKARPESRYCIECQDLRERKQTHYA